MFYSHDGLGLGHVRRNLAIAAAVNRRSPDTPVLLAASAEQSDRLGLAPNIDVLRLPGVRKVANEEYVPRRLSITMSDLRSLRSALLKSAVETFRPDVMLVDKHPLGIRGELTEALEVHAANGGRAFLGLRDILDDAASVRESWARYDIPKQIIDHYEGVLIYGQRDVYDVAAEYGLSDELSRRMTYCGYVRDASSEPTVRDISDARWGKRDRPVVLGSVGGGEDGTSLSRAFIEAARGAEWDALAVTGPQADIGEARRLRAAASEAKVRATPFVPQLGTYFRKADAVVCMGGYNTLVEAVASGAPTICVPRTAPRLEQHVRARAFAARGLLRVVPSDEVSGPRLRHEIEALLARRDERPSGDLNLKGAERAAELLVEAAAMRHRRIERDQRGAGSEAALA